MISQFSGAVMDAERKHRFILWRYWDDRPRMLFIGLNPSTANEIQDDPTIRRLMDFAQRWGYGGLYACNLFSQVTPYPEELLPATCNHPANTPAILMGLELSERVVCGWGDGIKKVPVGTARVDEVTEFLQLPMCFGLTAHGNPKHPLYLPGDSELEGY